MGFLGDLGTQGQGVSRPWRHRLEISRESLECLRPSRLPLAGSIELRFRSAAQRRVERSLARTSLRRLGRGSFVDHSRTGGGGKLGRAGGARHVDGHGPGGKSLSRISRRTCDCVRSGGTAFHSPGTADGRSGRLATRRDSPRAGRQHEKRGTGAACLGDDRAPHGAATRVGASLAGLRDGRAVAGSSRDALPAHRHRERLRDRPRPLPSPIRRRNSHLPCRTSLRALVLGKHSHGLADRAVGRSPARGFRAAGDRHPARFLHRFVLRDPARCALACGHLVAAAHRPDRDSDHVRRLPDSCEDRRGNERLAACRSSTRRVVSFARPATG